MNVGRLFAALGLDTKPFDEELDKTEKKGAGWAEKFSGATTKVLTAGFLAAGAAIGATTMAALDLGNQATVATNKAQAQLGLTKEKADELGKAALQVFGDNFTGSIEEAFQLSVDVQKVWQDMSGQDLVNMSEGVQNITDAFGEDREAVLNAAKALTEDFGMSGQEALDFITKGMQEGLNTSGDFLDSIGEYGVQFASGGADAGQFFSTLQTGLKAGVLGTDKAGDLFKEFRVRIQDGSDATRDGLKALGIDAEKVLKQLADGTMKPIEAFQLVQDKLRGTKDQSTLMQAGVALLGTQFEDLGQAAVLGIDTTKTSLTSMSGATQALNVQYNDLGSFATGVWRQIQVALVPVGQEVLKLANEAMPALTVGFNWLKDTLPAIVQGAIGAIRTFTTTVGDVLTTIKPVTDFLAANFQPILAGLVAMLLAIVVPAFYTWAVAAGTAAVATITALAPVIIPIMAIGAAVGLLYAAWTNNWGGIQDKLKAVWSYVEPVLATLWEWLGQKLSEAVQTLATFWKTTLWPAVQQVANWFTGTLFPTLQKLWDWLWPQLGAALKTLAAFWTDTLWPALKTVYSFVDANIIPILKALADVYIAAVSAAVRILAQLWTTVLWPALQKVWSFINASVTPVLKDLADKALLGAKVASQGLSDFWTGTLQPALQRVGDFVRDNLKPILLTLGNYLGGPFATAATVASGVFNNIGKAAEGVQGAVRWLLDKLSDLQDALNNLTLPDWFTPGSPTPWEWGIRGVNRHMGQLSQVELPALERSLNLNAPGLQAGTAMNTTNNTTLNLVQNYASGDGQSLATQLRQAQSLGVGIR